MPLKYVPPEEAFEVRIQCTEKQIQRHCDAAPENDRRDLDDQGGLQVPVYHVYKNGNISNRMTYIYTFDEAEGEDNEFDIRDLPTWSCLGEAGRSQVMGSLSERARFHESFLQEALDRGLVRIEDDMLVFLDSAFMDEDNFVQAGIAAREALKNIKQQGGE